jgi:biopolymer transport protein ExbD
MRFRGKFKQDLPGFQIAPMVDVIFNLLCFFLVAQIFSRWETEIAVKLPTAQKSEFPQRLPGEVIVNILKDGTIKVNGRQMDDAELKAMLQRVAGLFREQPMPIIIRADKATAYEHVVKVLDLCKISEIWNISFATSIPEGT